MFSLKEMLSYNFKIERKKTIVCHVCFLSEGSSCLWYYLAALQNLAAFYFSFCMPVTLLISILMAVLVDGIRGIQMSSSLLRSSRDLPILEQVCQISL